MAASRGSKTYFASFGPFNPLKTLSRRLDYSMYNMIYIYDIMQYHYIHLHNNS